jgi:hypothetical protein
MNQFTESSRGHLPPTFCNSGCYSQNSGRLRLRGARSRFSCPRQLVPSRRLGTHLAEARHAAPRPGPRRGRAAALQEPPGLRDVQPLRPGRVRVTGAGPYRAAGTLSAPSAREGGARLRPADCRARTLWPRRGAGPGAGAAGHAGGQAPGEDSVPCAAMEYGVTTPGAAGQGYWPCCPCFHRGLVWFNC